VVKPAVIYSGVHKRYLYHWTGRDIENDTIRGRTDTTNKFISPRTPLNNDQRKKYIDRVKRTLLNGLWIQGSTEQFGTGAQSLKICQPIVCFTEWALEESIPHVSRYGRLGFGFTKKFVLECGGQPVTYVNNVNTKSSGSPYLKSFLEIHKLLERLKPQLKTDTQFEKLVEKIEYLSAHHKNIRKVRNREKVNQVPTDPRMSVSDEATRPHVSLDC